MAATLWGGRDAVASHATAAALWGISGPGLVLHVTADRKLNRPPSGIRCHATRLARRDRGRLRGVPVTAVARTLLDLAADRTADEVFPAVERAVFCGLVTHEQLADVVARNRGRRGCRRLAGVLRDAETSALERRVEVVLTRSDLPPFVREHPVGPYRLDFAWPEQRVAVEADGRRWHSSARDFSNDRAKHNHVTAMGWRVLRVTWADLERPGDFVAATEGLLRDPAYPGPPGQTRSRAGGTTWQSRST